MTPADPITQWLDAHRNPAALPGRTMDIGPAGREALDAQHAAPRSAAELAEQQMAQLEAALVKLVEARDALADFERARNAGLNVGWRAGRRFTLWWALPLGMLLGACIFAVFATLGVRS